MEAEQALVVPELERDLRLQAVTQEDEWLCAIFQLQAG
jgi:hypothetical protein